MSNRFLEKLRNRPPRRSTNLLPRRNHQHRRLHCEALEDRRMLSIGPYPELPGMVLVDPVENQFQDQIVYLDFDGAADVTYDGPVVVEDIDIPAFAAPGELAGQEQQIIADVVIQLEETFADTGIIFTTIQPDSNNAYSTIFIGGDSSAFGEYGSFIGLAEQVDIGNIDPSDNGFVFSEILAGDHTAAGILATQVAEKVAHEAGHLVGYAHDEDDPDDGPLASVGAFSDYYSDYGADWQDRNHYITVGAGTYQFEVDGIGWYKWTEWYIGNSSSYPEKTQNSGVYWDPTFQWSFSEGTTVIRAEVYDNDWNWEEAHRWYVTVDTQGPEAPDGLDMRDSDDKGKSDDDEVTYIQRPYFEWNEPDDRGGSDIAEYHWRIRTSGGTLLHEDYTTSRSGRPSSNLSDDDYKFVVQAKDKWGNWGDWSSYLYFTIDATKPTKPWNLTNPENPTVDPTPNVNWSGTDNSGGSGIDHYVIAWDKPGDGNFATDFELESSNTQLSNSEWGSKKLDRVGVWNWWVQTIDIAGNESDWAPSYTNGKDLTFVEPAVVDVRWEKPYRAEVSDVNENDAVYLVVEATNFTSSHKFYADVIEGGLAGQGEQESNISLSHYSGNIWRGIWQAEWIQDAFDYTPTEWNYDPEYYIRIDSYGDTSGLMKVRDKTPPGKPAFDSQQSSHQPNVWLNNADLDIYWTEPNDGSGIEGYSVVVNNSPATLPDSSTKEATTRHYAEDNVLDNGSVYYHVRTKDNSGNWATDANVAHFGPFKIDTTDPGVPGELSNPRNPTTDLTPNVTWSEPTETGSGIWKYEVMFDDGDWDFGLIRDRTFWSANGDTDLDDAEITEALTIGNWQWWVRAYDVAGNTSGWAPRYFNGKPIEIVEPELTSVQWKTASGGSVTDGQRFKVGEDVRIYVEANYAQIGDQFTIYVYEDDGVDFDDLIDTVEVTILANNGAQGTGYVNWEVPWYPDNNFLSDLGVGDIQPEYRLWDTTSGWTVWPVNAHKSQLIEAHGGELPSGEWTVIIHGLTTSAYNTLANADGWMRQMAQTIRDESLNLITGLSNVVIHTMDAVTGEINDGGSTTPEDPNRHHILLFDWAEVSNYDTQSRFFADPSDPLDLKRLITDPPPDGAQGEDGYAEASADVLYALLERYDIADRVDTLIGFSRGAVVASETAQRLLVDGDGVGVDQVIYLDGEGGGSSSATSDPDIGLYADDQFWAWTGTDTINAFSSFNEGVAADFAAILPLLVAPNAVTQLIADLGPLLIPDVNLGGHGVAGAHEYDAGVLYMHEDLPYAPYVMGKVYGGFYHYLIGDSILDPSDGVFVLNGDLTTSDIPTNRTGSTRNPALDAPESMEIFNGDFSFDSTAGWWYHGGGDNAVSAGGGTVENGHLVLDHGESRTHNWAYIPSTARSIRFDLNVTTPSSTANLKVYWWDQDGNSHLMDSIPITSGSTGTAKRVPLPVGVWDSVGRVKFSLEGTDTGQVHLDNIAFSSTPVDQSFTVAIAPSSFLETAGSSAATGTVSRSGPLVSTVVVSLSSSDTDEATVPTTVTIPVGQTSATFAVDAEDDTVYDQTQSVTITASASGYNFGSANIQVTDNELPGLAVAINPSTFAENAGNNAATGTVTRQGPTSSAVTVNLSSSDTGEATVPTTVTIHVGQTSATFAVDAVDDTVYDQTQSVTITASATGYTLGAANVQVTDNELPSLTVTIDPVTFGENVGSSAATGMVIRQGPTSSAVTVNLSSSDTSEATVPAMVTIPIGETSATFAVDAVDDTVYDQTQSVTITASVSGYNSGSANIQVTDNELPGLAVAINSSTFAENAGNSAATGTVTRQGPTSSAVTVNLSSSDTGEATVPATVTIPVGQASATFAVDAVDDTVYDQTQSVTITASATGYTLGTANVQVTDNELPSLTVTIDPATFGENAGSSAATGTVTRQGPTSSAVTVNLSSSDTGEATVPATVTIPVGETSATFAVDAVDDTDIDGIQNVTITASAADYSSGTTTARVTDDETPKLTLVVNPSTFAENGGGNAAIGTITRNLSTDAAVTVTLSSNDTTEVTVQSTVTIPAGQSSATFPVNAVNDDVDDDAQNVTITASATGHTSGNAQLEVTDDDTAGVTVAPIADLITTEEANGTATFTVVLDSKPTANVTINLSSSDTTEGTVPPESFTIEPDDWDLPVTVTITGVNDPVADGDIAYTIITSATSDDPKYNGIEVSDVSVTNLDDEVPGVTVAPTSGLVTTEDGDTATFTVVLDSKPTADVTINLSSSDTTEGTVSTTVPLLFEPGDWDTPIEVTVTGEDDDVADGDVAYTIITSATSDDPIYDGIEVNDVSLINCDMGISSVVFAEAGTGSNHDGIKDSGDKLVITWATPDGGKIVSYSLYIEGANGGVVDGLTVHGPFGDNFCGVFGPIKAGEYEFTIQTTDDAGDTFSYNDNFQVEQRPATGKPNVFSVEVAEADRSIRDGNLQSDEKLVITWTAADPDGIGRQSIMVDGRQSAPVWGPYGGNYCGVFGPMAAGEHQFVINSTDTTGQRTDYTGYFNVGQSSIFDVVIAEDFGQPRDGLLRSDEQLVLTWAVADAGRVAARNLWIDDRLIAPVYGPFGNAFAGRLGSLSAGTHEYTVEVIDRSGTASREYGKFHVAAFADLAPPLPIIPIPLLDAAFQDQDGSPLPFGLEATLGGINNNQTATNFAAAADEVFGGYGE